MNKIMKSFVTVAIACMVLAGYANDTSYGPFGSSDDWTYEAGNKDRTATPVIGLNSAVYIGGVRAKEGDCIAAYRKDKNVICGLGRVDSTGKTGIKFEVNSGVEVRFKLWIASSGTENPEIRDVDASCDFTVPDTDLPTVDLGMLTVTLQKSFGSGMVSRFEVDGSSAGTLVGASEVSWRDFSGTDSYGTKVFAHDDIVDVEKTAADDNDDYWCYPMSDMNALYLTGWAELTGYDTVDAMKDSFKLSEKLLRGIDKNGAFCEGEFGFNGNTTWGDFFEWYERQTGIDLVYGEVVTEGEVGSSFLSELSELMDSGENVVRINVFFDEVLYNRKWKGSAVSHGVLCVGYVADGDELKALFIIDPDNDQYKGAGGVTAPNSVMYCPVSWDEDAGCYTISGVWGQDGVVCPEYRAIRTMPEIYTVTFEGGGGTGEMAVQKIAEDVPQALTACGFVRPGYEFTGWKDQFGDFYDEEDEILPSCDLILTAQWELIPLLSLDEYGRRFGWHGTSGASFAVSCNTSWTVSVDVDWIELNTGSGSGDGTVEYSVFENSDPNESRKGTIKVETDDGMVYAVFEVEQRKWSEIHFITVDMQNGEETYEIEVDDGEEFSLSLSGTCFPGRLEKDGYVLSGWLDDEENEYEVGETVVVERDMTIYAQWDSEMHVTAEAKCDEGAKGDVSPASKTVDVGSSVTLNATAGNSGTLFAYWEDEGGDIVGYSSKITVKPSKWHSTYYAVFRTKSACEKPVLDAEDAFGSDTGYTSENSMVGVAYEAMIGLEESMYPVKFTAKGLPPGLKINSASGVISGVPTKAGKFTPAITVQSRANSRWKSTVKPVIEIAKLPAGARGTFNGSVEGYDGLTGGAVTLTVGSTGKISGKIALGGTNWTVSVSSWSGDSQSEEGDFMASGTATFKSGKKTYKMPWEFELQVEPSDGGDVLLSSGYGMLAEVEFYVYRNVWKDSGASALLSGWTGAYDYVTAAGDPLTLTLDSRGTVKASGTLSSGRKISLSTALMYSEDGYVAVLYAPPQTVTVKSGKKKVKVTYPAFHECVTLQNETGIPEAGEYVAYRRQGVRVTASEESTGTGSFSYSTSYGQAAPGESITVTAKPANGALFAYWLLNEEVVGYGQSYKVTMGEGDFTGLEAVFRTKSTCEKPVLDTEDAFGNGYTSENSMVGVAYEAMIGLEESMYPVKFTAKGLPPGLKVNSASGVISGVPTKAGKFTPAITVQSRANSRWKSTVKPVIEIAKLPAGARGTFNGSIEGNDGLTGGSVTLTVGSTGKISGKIALGGTNWTVSASSWSGDSQSEDGDFTVSGTATFKSGKKTYKMPWEFGLQVEPSDGEDVLVCCGEGSLGAANFFVCRNIWKDAGASSLLSGWTGAYDYITAAGDPLTLTLDSRGTVKAYGTLSSGRKISLSTALMYSEDEYVTVLYAPPQTVTVKSGKKKVKVTYPAFHECVMLQNEPGTPEAEGYVAYRRQGVRVTVSEDSTGSGSFSYSTTYGQAAPGKSITVTAKPANGALFAYWLLDGDAVGYDPSYKVTMGEGDFAGLEAVFRTKSACEKPVLDAEDVFGSDTGYTSENCMVGVAYEAMIGLGESMYPVKFTAKGLPPGLKINSASGVITGVPTKAGKFTPVITVQSKANSRWKSTVKSVIEIAELPDWASGTFVGVADACSGEVEIGRGSSVLTIGSTGKMSGKAVIENGKTLSFSFNGYTGFEDDAFIGDGTVTYKAGKKSCRLSAHIIVGEGGASFTLLGDHLSCNPLLGFDEVASDVWRTDWKGEDKSIAAMLKEKKGAFTTEEPGEAGFLYAGSVKFGSYGAVTVTYRTVDPETGIKSKNTYSASGTACKIATDPESGDMTLVVPLVFTKPSHEYMEVLIGVDADGTIKSVDL